MDWIFKYFLPPCFEFSIVLKTLERAVNGKVILRGFKCKFLILYSCRSTPERGPSRRTLFWSMTSTMPQIDRRSSKCRPQKFLQIFSKKMWRSPACVKIQARMRQYKKILPQRKPLLNFEFKALPDLSEFLSVHATLPLL